MSRRLPPLLIALTAVAMPIATWFALIYAPTEKVMGDVQRIFYFHVPAAIAAYLACAVLLIGSILYLSKRDLRWDDLSRSATEVALLFCTLVLVTGPIWAKPAWGAWWTWEARLVSTLVLELLLIASLLVRRYADSRDLGARLAAILGITIVADVYIIHKAVEWWRGQHPQVFKAGGKGSLDPRMSTALLVGLACFTLLTVTLMVVRYRAIRVASRTEALQIAANAGELQ